MVKKLKATSQLFSVAAKQARAAQRDAEAEAEQIRSAASLASVAPNKKRL